MRGRSSSSAPRSSKKSWWSEQESTKGNNGRHKYHHQGSVGSYVWYGAMLIIVSVSIFAFFFAFPDPMPLEKLRRGSSGLLNLESRLIETLEAHRYDAEPLVVAEADLPTAELIALQRKRKDAAEAAKYDVTRTVAETTTTSPPLLVPADVITVPHAAAESPKATTLPKSTSVTEADGGNISKNKKSNNNNNKNDNNKNKKNKRPKDPPLYNFEPEWGYNGEEKYISVNMPQLKIPLKKDRRVVFTNMSIVTKHHRSGNEVPTNIPGQPRELLRAIEVLKKHPIRQMDPTLPLEEAMMYVTNSEQCKHLPLFLTMATVGDPLYWQLVDNFVYTMVKFNLSACSMIICVSDARCVKACEDSYYPCYNYQDSRSPLPSVMEQIAEVKLLHIPRAMEQGVDTFLLDLDVGFLASPMNMIEVFDATKRVDIFVQEDYIFIMNRTKAGWKTWFTEPLPNIGMFLSRGNNRTTRVFNISWEKYRTIESAYDKAQPGKDQNTVLDAMRVGRGTFGLKYAYFDNYSTPLLDKLVLNHGNIMELGGEQVGNLLEKYKSIAIHTTCYEKATKVMGLKATGAFWSPKYYDPLTRTITKQILYVNDAQLLDELRSLVYLAIHTKRSLIIPNILGPESIDNIEKYKNQSMWPGFRVLYIKKKSDGFPNPVSVEVLEPQFYWRIDRDYDPIPDAHVVEFSGGNMKSRDLMHLLDELLQPEVVKQTRVILHHRPKGVVSGYTGMSAKEMESLMVWANHSVGLFPSPYKELIGTYQSLPSVKDIQAMGDPLVTQLLNGLRTCNKIFGGYRGNRTCFQICD